MFSNLVTGRAGSLRGMQLKKEEHEDPEVVGGAQHGHQLAKDRQAPVSGHVRQCIGKHVHDFRHHSVHMRRGAAIRELLGLESHMTKETRTSYYLHNLT